MHFLSLLIAFSGVASVYGSVVAADGASSASAAVDDSVLMNTETDRCTTIVVGPKAGIEGAMTTHTADCANCDFRIGKVTFMLG